MTTLHVHTAIGEHSLNVRPGGSVLEALKEIPLHVAAACGGSGCCGTCVVHLLSGTVNAPTVAELHKLSPDELARGLRLACQLRLENDARIELVRSTRRARWLSIPENELAPCPGCRPELRRNVYGVAVDLGTSHIRVTLWDCARGRRIATRCGANPQETWGADVLSRLVAAQANPRHRRMLAALPRAAILRAVRDILAKNNNLDETRPLRTGIGRLVVVGNTAMLALLTEHGGDALLDPGNWQRPIDCQPREPKVWRSKWRLPNAELVLPQPLAGFVGSDLLAAVLATRLTEGPAGSLLLDVGTNTELALWDGATLHVTSVPGGSAFEGVGIRFGMAAEPGAIDRVIPNPNGEGFVCETRGGLPARGLCGSGLLDAVAVLLEAGILRPSGRFVPSPGSQGYRLDPALPRSAITAADVDAIQRAKAATAAAIEQLLAFAGMNWQDLARLCVCGAFGGRLDLRHAQAIGLLPPIAVTRVELHPNAALLGCERALLADDAASMFSEITRKAKTVNLASVEGWEDRYLAHLRLGPSIPLKKGLTNHA